MGTDQRADRNREDDVAQVDVLDGAEILTCTVATMDVLRRAVSDELGLDEAEEYGLAPLSPALAAVEDGRDPSPG